jgi:hypothetical protein
MKKAGRRRSTISTASWRRELRSPGRFPCAPCPGDAAPLASRSGDAQVDLPSACAPPPVGRGRVALGQDSRDGRDWKPREPLPGPLGQREEVDR